MTLPRKVLVFGASGQIGSALAARLDASRGSANVYRFSWRDLAAGSLNRISEDPVDIVFATGLTDPSRRREELFEANLRFPQKVAEWSASKRRNADRFLTLGTILERFPELCRTNAYIASKLALAEWISRQDLSRFAHIRLHTVYGGAIKPHMFLGQIAEALRKNDRFHMSSGSQLREYHHVEDVARFLQEFLVRDGFGDAPVTELTSGHVIRLADLAESVFRALGREGQLEIGSLAHSDGENFNQRFAPSPAWFVQSGRDPMQGVIEWLRQTDCRGPDPGAGD